MLRDAVHVVSPFLACQRTNAGSPNRLSAQEFWLCRSVERQQDATWPVNNPNGVYEYSVLYALTIPASLPLVISESILVPARYYNQTSSLDQHINGNYVSLEYS